MTDKLSEVHRDPAGGHFWAPSGAESESSELQTRITAQQPAVDAEGKRAGGATLGHSAADELGETLKSRTGRPDSSQLTPSGVRPEDVLPVPPSGGYAPKELLPESRGETMRAHVERMEVKDPMGVPGKGEDDLDTMKRAADLFDQVRQLQHLEAEPSAHYNTLTSCSLLTCFTFLQKKERTLYSDERNPNPVHKLGESIEKVRDDPSGSTQRINLNTHSYLHFALAPLSLLSCRAAPLRRSSRWARVWRMVASPMRLAASAQASRRRATRSLADCILPWRPFSPARRMSRPNPESK